MFTLGDIVKPKFSSNGLEYYIVTDSADFSKKNDGSDMSYEIMRIFPISKLSRVENLDEKRLEVVAKANTKDSQLILDFVRKKRAEKGWMEAPDYQAQIYINKKAVTGVVTLTVPDDVIRYDLLETVDACLDRMNDLQELYNVFGDEAYLQLREVVQNRLKQLI